MGETGELPSKITNTSVVSERPATVVRDEEADAFVIASRALVGLAIRSINASPVEVTLVQHRLMVLLGSGACLNVGELAEQLGVDQSNASRLCDRLQKVGLITRERSDVDRRAVEVSLTPAGQRVLDTVNAYRREEVVRVLGRLSPRQVAAATRALAAFSEAVHEASHHEGVPQVL